MKHIASINRLTHTVDLIQCYGDVEVRESVDHYLYDVTAIVETNGETYLIGSVFDPLTQTFAIAEIITP